MEPINHEWIFVAGSFMSLKTKVAAYNNHLSQVYQYYIYQSFSHRGYKIKKMVWTIKFYKQRYHGMRTAAATVKSMQDVKDRIDTICSDREEKRHSPVWQ